MRNKTDVELVALLVASDQAAWTEFRRRFHNLILSAVSRIVDPSFVDDASSEAYFNLLRGGRYKLRAWDPKRGKLSSWVFRIARRAAIDLSRSGRADFSGDAEIPIDLCDDTTPERIVGAREGLMRAAAVGSKLEGNQGRVFAGMLRDLGDTDISRETGINVQTVGSSRNRIVHKLKEAA